jgi:hypothetical protein
MTCTYIPEQRDGQWDIAGYGGDPEVREGVVITVASLRAARVIAGVLEAARTVGVTGRPAVYDPEKTADAVGYLLAASGTVDSGKLREAVRGAYTAGVAVREEQAQQPGTPIQ